MHKITFKIIFKKAKTRKLLSTCDVDPNKIKRKKVFVEKMIRQHSVRIQGFLFLSKTFKDNSD